MRTNKTRALIVGLSVVAAGLLAACSPEPATPQDKPAPTSGAAPSTSAGGDESAAPESTPAPTESEGGTGGGTDDGSGDGVDEAGGENCGPVEEANGPVDVFAADTPAGTVGCVEAINVATEYLADAPGKGEGTAYALTVDGWSCLTDTGVQGSGTVGCEKDGLAFHTLP